MSREPQYPWSPGKPAHARGLGVELRSMTPADIDDALVAQLRDPTRLGEPGGSA